MQTSQFLFQFVGGFFVLGESANTKPTTTLNTGLECPAMPLCEGNCPMAPGSNYPALSSADF
jgi:hypothetical protein